MAKCSRKKRGFSFVAASIMALSGLLSSGIIANTFADGTNKFILGDTCDYVKNNEFTCTFKGTERTLFIGSLRSDGAFESYSEDAAEYNGDSRTYTVNVDNAAENGRIHIEGDDSGVMADADGARLRFEGGNVKLGEVFGRVFSLTDYVDDQPGNEPGNEPGGSNQVDNQQITWTNPTGGKIEISQICEPAWVYDENAAEDEFMPCADVKDGDDEEAYSIRQDQNGGDLRIERGIKVIFSIIPDEGYTYKDIDYVVDPSNVEISGMGDDRGFEFVMPQNVKITIKASFTGGENENPTEEEDDEIPVEFCDSNGKNCRSANEYFSAESDDIPEGSTVVIGTPENGEEVWNDFAENVFGNKKARFDALVEAYSAAEDEEEEKNYLAQMINELGAIVIEAFEINLKDADGKYVDYAGNGITINMSSEIVDEMYGWLASMVEGRINGKIELVIGHLKHDGTYEYLPVTDNGDGTYSFTVKSLSPFAFVARKAAATTPATIDTNPKTLDAIMNYVCLAVISLAGLVYSGLTVRKFRKE